MKIGILGYGRAGQRHGRILDRLGMPYVYYDPQAAGCRTREQVLEESDAIIIATPNHEHLTDMNDCITYGKHCLVEKPIAMLGQSNDVQRSLKIAKEKEVKVAVGFNLRFGRAANALRRMMWVDDQRTISILPIFASFVCCQAPDQTSSMIEGCLNHWACHEIDLARHLIGHLIPVDSRVTPISVDLRLRGTGATQVHIHSDMVAEQRIRYAVVVSEPRSMVVDMEKSYPVQDTDYQFQTQAFLAMIDGRPSFPLATGEEGLAVLKLSEMIHAR